MRATRPLALTLLVLCACATHAGRPSVVPIARALRPEVQGHRGCRGLRPENTMAAFEHAITLGVDVLELDLALSRDDVLVVVHDPEVNPAICTVDAAHPLPSLRFSELTVEQIETIDCGSRPNPGYPEQTPVPGEGIPTFEQVLVLLEHHLALRANVEIKTFPDRRAVTRSPEDFARVLVARIRERGLARRVTVQSFDPEALRAVGRLAPEIERVALVERSEDIEPMLATGARVLSPKASLLGEGDVERYHGRGIRVIPWTVNDVAQMQQMIRWGVDGIITDRPDVLRGLLR